MNHLSQVVAGNFDAETLWRKEKLCKLPFIPDAASIQITSCLDEILFLLCKEEDVLITNKAFDPTFLQYLNSLGITFQCNRKDLPNKEGNGQTDVFRNLMQVSQIQDYMPELSLNNRVLNTFAVTEYAKTWCGKNQVLYQYPNMEVIKTVNSKLYSYHLRNQLNIDIGSKIAESSNDLLSMGNHLLSEGNTVIIKDMYGVSGKGNILVNSKNMLQRIVKYIQNQEKEGKKVEFLLEPFLDKEFDFTCIASIDPDGSHRILDIQYMQATGFAYSGTTELTKELKDRIYQSTYVTIVSEVCKALYKSGYYGDVCVDSMMQKNQEMVPIVEINARKSMTYLKYHLDGLLRKHGLIGKFTYVPFYSLKGFTMETLLNQMRGQNLLFTLENRAGVMPLSANTLGLITNPKEGEITKTKSKGRLYYAVVGEDVKALDEISLKANTFMKEYGSNKY